MSTSGGMKHLEAYYKSLSHEGDQIAIRWLTERNIPVGESTQKTKRTKKKKA
jgi:hypothetical protein